MPILLLAAIFWSSMWLGFGAERLPQQSETNSAGLRLGVFDIDATPPVGSMMAYDPVTNKWTLGLRARGIVLLGSGQPIVLCAVDWIGIANGAHDEFCQKIAEAAGTTRTGSRCIPCINMMLQIVIFRPNKSLRQQASSRDNLRVVFSARFSRIWHELSMVRWSKANPLLRSVSVRRGLSKWPPTDESMARTARCERCVIAPARTLHCVRSLRGQLIRWYHW